MNRHLRLWILMLAALVLASSCAAPAPTATPTKAPVATPAAKVAEPTKAAPAVAPTVPPGQKELVLMGYGGTQETAFKEAIIPPFEKKYGVKVTWVTATSGTAAASKIIAQKDNPEVDVLYLADTGFLQLKQAGVLAKIDLSRVTNYNDTYEIFRDPDLMGAPQGVIANGMAYNTKIFKEKGIASPTSWNDLWKPEFKGHVGLASINLSTGHSWLPLVAKMETGDSKNIDAAFAKAKTLVPNVFLIYTAAPQLDDALKPETVWIANANSQRTYSLQAQGFPVDFVYPKEGTLFFTNQYIITKGAPHPELAQEFVNFALGQEAQAALAKAGGFGPTTKKVTLPQDVAKTVVYGPDQIAKLVPSDWPWITANLGAWTERWNKEIEGK